MTKSQRKDAMRWISNCLRHLGDVCLEQGDFEASRKYLDREGDVIDLAGHYTARPIVDYLRGRLALVKGELEKAIGLLTEAVKGYQRYRREEGLGDLLLTLGDAYVRKGDRVSGKDKYTLASKVNISMGNQRAADAARKRLQAVDAAISYLSELFF